MSVSNLFDGYNAGYAQELYEQYARNPESVSPQWRAIFSQNLDELVDAGLIVPDALRENGGAARGREAAPAPPPPVPTAGVDVGSGREGVDQSVMLPRIARAAALIQAFRDHGHQLARIDPLGSEPPGHPQLDPAFFGTSTEDLEEIAASLILEHAGEESLATTLTRLRGIYCGSIGYQFEHLEDPEKVRWLWEQVESGRHSKRLQPAERVALLRRLTEVEGMERFLHRAYLGQKRFSIEGTDMLVPMLDLAIHEAAEAGGTRVVFGMAHRGRLNVLVQIVGIDYRALLREFEGAPQEEGALALTQPGTGDVKYHQGARGKYRTQDGYELEVTLAPNPSHLEYVDPVVVGMTRALQYEGPEKNDRADRSAVVPILIHGDAAFAAEGVVAESLNLARLEGYSVGGAVHIIVNNQVGFTTDPQDGRSTRYASDLAKGYDIPILHVNADDPEACLAAIRLAMAYRATYRDDVLIDLVGYRRFGHNEGDEPAYTQPLLYRKIESHPSVRAQWAERLISEEVLSQEEASAMEDEVVEELRNVQQEVQEEVEESAEPASPPAEPDDAGREGTAVTLERLVEANAGALKVPESFVMHPKLKRQLERRKTGFGPESELDWAHAESLALGSILQEGVPVRLTGQDTERGTFSQRHLVLHDQETGDKVTPLREVGTARFEIYNSPLSEMAVLGFEYGCSVAAFKDFVLWEAQFGDFVNAAQVIVDQFIASGRAKWGQLSRLTLLLPHGYEGQGPEHSSARLERFLQLCAEDNLRVAYPTTPAQYFHLLRRQALGATQRPLVVMTPKSLLRHPAATSRVEELAEGRFRPVLRDAHAPGGPADVRRLILCSGKLYYDLSLAPERADLDRIAIGRVEELYPFPADELRELVGSYEGLEEVLWAQEEPMNMGALGYIGPRLRSVVPREIPLRHVARPERASPAEGKHKKHRRAQERIVRDVLDLS
jgi:2-oxoglutarate dehydrogenase E1 component